jgi:hypothetical protein
MTPPAKPSSAIFGHELERELRALPVAVDDRRDLAVAERAQAVADRALLVGQALVEQIEIGGHGG